MYNINYIDKLENVREGALTRPYPNLSLNYKEAVLEIEIFKSMYSKADSQKFESLNVDFEILENLYNVATYDFYTGKPKFAITSPKSWITPSISKYIEESFKESTEEERLKATQELKQYFLDSVTEYINIPWDRIPGYRPIRKAVYVYLNYFAEEIKDSTTPDSTGSAASISKQFKKASENSRSTSSSEERMTALNARANSLFELSKDKELSELLTNSEKDPYFLNIDDPNFDIQFNLGESMNKFSDILSVSSKTTYDPDTYGSIIHSHTLTKLSDLSRISGISWALGENLTKIKAVNKQLTYLTNVSPTKRKQLLYMLVDTSGSMSIYYKIAAVNYVMANRLAAVMKDDAELYFSFYEKTTYEEYHIKTKKEAKEFFKTHSKHNYHKGVTDINHVLRLTIDRCEHLLSSNETLFRPHIMIVCDGQDYVDSAMNCNGYVVHSIHLETFNPALAELSRRTGGASIHIETAKILKNAANNNKNSIIKLTENDLK